MRKVFFLFLVKNALKQLIGTVKFFPGARQMGSYGKELFLKHHAKIGICLEHTRKAFVPCNFYLRNMFREIGILIRKEFELEMRNKVALSGVLLYVITTIFVCYLSFQSIEDQKVWNTLFWIILLFSAVNTISKSFFLETRGRLFYLYTIASPAAVVLSKMLYNMLLMISTAGITILFYALFLGSKPIEGANLGMYLTALLLGASGFAGIFTLISAISARTNNTMGIMAILGFPLILPLLTTLILLSDVSLRGLTWDYGYREVMILGGINVLVAALSYLLFPYLWRE